jgi:transposase-like protein
MTTLNKPAEATAVLSEPEIRCPKCKSAAIYKYGKTSAGSKRYLCMMCKRQFTRDSIKKEIKGRPLCPACGRAMHVYMKSATFIRFRCSNYPECKTFKKLLMEDV